MKPIYASVFSPGIPKNCFKVNLDEARHFLVLSQKCYFFSQCSPCFMNAPIQSCRSQGAVISIYFGKLVNPIQTRGGHIVAFPPLRIYRASWGLVDNSCSLKGGENTCLLLSFLHYAITSTHLSCRIVNFGIHLLFVAMYKVERCQIYTKL